MNSGRKFRQQISATLIAAALLCAAASLPAVTSAKARTAASGKKKLHKAPVAKAPAASAKAPRSKAHAHVRYTGAKVSTATRTELIEEIGTRLKEPPEHVLSYSKALDGFYAQLAAREIAIQKGETPTETVRALQWGDSHTAADMFTGEARRVFQQQFGNGGIGYAYAGRPFLGYRILGSKQAQSTGWKTIGNKFQQLGDGQLGMGGIAISTEHAGDWVTLDATCASLDLQYLKQPGGGGLQFTDNGGQPVSIDTSAEATGPGTFHYNCPAGDHHFEVMTLDRSPVTLLGWVATQPGATWESIGINGAEAPLLLRWDQKLFSSYLQDNAPALIVLAYGTNEAASHAWDEESYQQTFANLIDTLHGYAPAASILVLGPADRSTIQRRKWLQYTGTDKIVSAQKSVCRTHGCSYWDQQARMGGLGSMQQWASVGMAQGDHTHFTGEGYRALADALMADLMTGFQKYKERHLPAMESAAQGESGGSTNP